ncbi:MAG: 3-methyl-2-oxobutanoate hydroxymethyltransferase [Pseudomonadota bacterium]
MKRIYDFGRRPAKRNYTLADLRALKGSGKRLTMCNPKNATEIQACVDAGIDLLTVWDNQMEEARRIAPTTFMGTGTTWAQYATPDDILRNALDFMEKGCDLYYTLRSYDVLEMLTKENIPVQSHIGLIPTFSHWCGGLRAWGRTAEEAMEIYRTIKRLEDVGVFAVEVECIAEEVLKAVTEKTSVVTFSLGSGNAGEAVFAFMADICGEDSEEETPPKHAYAFGNLGRLHKQIYEERVAALKEFQAEVTALKFPYRQTSVFMHPDEEDKFLEALDKAT